MLLYDVDECAEMRNGGLVLDAPGHALRGTGFGRPAGNVGSIDGAVGYKGRNHPVLDLIPDVIISVGVDIQPPGSGKSQLGRQRHGRNSITTNRRPARVVMDIARDLALHAHTDLTPSMIEDERHHAPSSPEKERSAH